MKFSMIGIEKCKLLIQVIAWARLTTYILNNHRYIIKLHNIRWQTLP